jgi:outer membrane biosynthesis protein TonB
MAIRLRQRKAIVRQLAEFFLELGRVPADRREYGELKDAPVRVFQLSSYFGAWGSLLDSMQKQEPELWAKIHAPKPKAAPKPAPKPIEPKPKPAPAKVAPKPAPKPVVKKEKNDE